MPVMPARARKMLCAIWVGVSTGGSDGVGEDEDKEEEEGRKKVGEGTKTPLGGMRAGWVVIVVGEVSFFEMQGK